MLLFLQRKFFCNCLRQKHRTNWTKRLAWENSRHFSPRYHWFPREMKPVVASWNVGRFLRLLKDQTSVVQRLDSAVWINLCRWIVQLVSPILIRWIVIYPVDSTIRRLNNWGLTVLYVPFRQLWNWDNMNPISRCRVSWSKEREANWWVWHHQIVETLFH